MKTLKSFLMVVVTVMLAGCATSRYNFSAHEQRDDQSLKLRAVTALSDNPDYKFEGVTVTVSNGVARLDGFVDLPAQKLKAGDIVTHVSGIREIDDNILLKAPGTGGTAEANDDKSLTAVVKSVLDENPDYRYQEVTVAVFQGAVHLNGFVNTPEQKNHAGDLARAVPGVTSVLNNITIKDVL